MSENAKLVDSTEASPLDNSNNKKKELAEVVANNYDNANDTTNVKIRQINYNIIENTRLHDLVGIQPLTGPTGKCFTLRVRTSDCGANVALDALVHAIEACTRQLKASIPSNALSELIEFHGYSEEEAEEEVTTVATHELTHQIEQSIYRELIELSTKHDYVTLVETGKPEAIMLIIGRIANEIARTTLRGSGNFVVMSTDMANLLVDVLDNKPSKDDREPLASMMYVGTLFKNLKVFVNPYAEREELLIGYKGSSELDVGYVYCPFIVALSSGVVQDAGSGDLTEKFITRFGKHISDNCADYYHTIQIDF